MANTFSFAASDVRYGERLSSPKTFGEFSRYAVYPVWCRSFDARGNSVGGHVEWFVADAERRCFGGRPEIIRQATSEEEAVAGL